MKKVFYEQIQTGKTHKYVAVSEYDNDFLDSFPKGNHLVMSYPGGSSRRYNVDPNYAAMIAAGRVAEDAICKALLNASELKPDQTPVTEGQRRAWKRLAKEFGSDLCTLRGTSMCDIAKAAVKAMQAEADELMQHPAVKDAYEQFQAVCNLVKAPRTS